MKFYAASSFRNIDAVRTVTKGLKEKGWSLTYDWTQGFKDATIEQFKEIGQQEKQAVMDADCLIIMLPAGKGSHIEMGIALGAGKKVYLYAPNGETVNLETTSTFYHLDEVGVFTGTVDELIEGICRA
ncbi:nucleoside 2-deoxyribosyltransferase [Paenibacillus konkukensis]|nr:nucleoside 2-deoxyribosyltransferase [Paenibacillus konkukensis]